MVNVSSKLKTRHSGKLTWQSSPLALSSHINLLGSYSTFHTEGSEKTNTSLLGFDLKLLKCIPGWFWDTVISTHSFADRRAGVGFIRAKLCCQLTTGLQGSVVHGLKDLNVEQLGLWAFKRIAHEDKGISQTLHTNSNWPVTLVRPFSL